MSINITKPPAPPLQALALNQSVRSEGPAEGMAKTQVRRNRPVWSFTPLQALTAILILVAALAVSLTLLAQQGQALAAGVTIDESETRSSPPANSDVNSAAHLGKQASGNERRRNTPNEAGSQQADPVSGSAQHTEKADNAAALASSASSGSTDQAGRVNLNSASQQDLENVKGIGPVKAAKILEHRRAIGGRYTSVDQLLDVPGIGAKTLARLRPYLVAQ
ncbi:MULTISPECIES: ComEA family DNA-binding protein [Bifidobacterium]|uniref:ComEA family DNA-binding protein n=1 Tax=Bifidobacterium TaxID=1678 RepID=UPI0018DE8677|nr:MULTISPECIES: helix-hairpin-helix domain-containing protein [Bifidobacterium]MBH9980539.1 helix-hairpin-helix domain-containing protein [Bifidobacterium asteroides]MBI0099926.1 helix-hairpin-helix domain-containing protein [Bifidobacterium sp. W8114]